MVITHKKNTAIQLTLSTRTKKRTHKLQIVKTYMCRTYKSKKIIVYNTQWPLKTHYEDNEQFNSNMGQRDKQTTQPKIHTDCN